MASYFSPSTSTEGYMSRNEIKRSGQESVEEEIDVPVDSISLSCGSYSPTPGGPFSALTPSMWPQHILAKLSQPESDLKRSEDESSDFMFDEFGFRVYEMDDGGATSSLENERVRMKWVAYLEFTNNTEVEDMTWDKIGVNIPRDDKLTKMVETAGVPHSLRHHIWPRISSAAAKKASAETSYKEIVKASSNDALVTSKQIEKDLLRTLPSNVCFSSINATGIGRLRRILRAVAWLYPDIGYCQGMGVIVAHLLLFMEEEDTFWQMCSLLEDIVPPSYYSSSLLGLQADQKVLRHLLTTYAPNVDHLLCEHDIELSLITLQWFLTLFASVVRTRVLLRIWDLLFYHGPVVFFKFALGMLQMKEDAITKLDNSAQIFNLISDIPGDITDFDAVVDASLQSTTPLNSESIEEMRRNFLAHLMTDHGALLNPDSGSNLPKQKISRRQIKRSRSIIQELLLAPGSLVDADDDTDIKSKNVRQTELMINLRESILNVARHFQASDARYSRVSLNGDYSVASHQRDLDNFIATMNSTKKRRAKALLDFERHDDDELGFKKNDIINILSQRDEHCWVGELNGLRGWFPAKFVEVLDERSKQYSTAGDDTVNEHIADLVRGQLCPAIKAMLEHGLKKSSLLGGVVCHPWLFIEEAAQREVQRDFNSVYSRLVLCKTFRLDEDGKVLSPEEILYRCVQLVTSTHDPHHAQMDVKLRSLVCLGLNEQVLHLWLETLCSSTSAVNKWYQPWSFLRSPGWVQIKCELRILSNFAFTLSPDWELPVKARKDTQKPMKEGVRDMLVKHHLFSWDL